MRLYSESTDSIKAECERCERILNVPRSYASKSPSGFTLSPSVKCPCGEISNIISSKDDRIKCPKCRSVQVTAGNKGFGLGKAAVGGLALGSPVGLLAGLIGSKKVVISCLKCGNRWQAGK